MTAACVVCLALAAHAGEPKRATDGFRAEHGLLEREFDLVGARVAGLAELSPRARRAEMSSIVTFFQEDIGTHTSWEEEVLYPAVDRRMPTPGPEAFTASLRHDHRVVERWIGELDTYARAETPDAAAFARRTYNLLGLVRAHFEAEEDVLLPILDRTMTAEQYQEEILERGAH